VHTLDCTAEVPDGDDALDLHAVLAQAASNIRDGVGLKTLRSAPCRTSVWRVEGVHHFRRRQPSKQEIAAVYTPVGRSLHGLVGLELSDSSCSQEVLDAVVAAAPDLRVFEIGWRPAYSAVDSMQSSRRIRCSGLEELTVHVDLDGRERFRHIALTLQLEDSSSLRTCCVSLDRFGFGELRVGDRVKVALECHGAGSVPTSVCSWEPYQSCEGHGRWHLRCLLQDSEERGTSQEKEQVTVSFEWGPDQAWITNLHRPA
jgi:hypothetical protein